MEEEKTRDPSENHDNLQTNILTLEEQDQRSFIRPNN
jgi:hypothetical protein